MHMLWQLLCRLAHVLSQIVKSFLDVERNQIHPINWWRDPNHQMLHMISRAYQIHRDNHWLQRLGSVLNQSARFHWLAATMALFHFGFPSNNRHCHLREKKKKRKRMKTQAKIVVEKLKFDCYIVTSKIQLNDIQIRNYHWWFRCCFFIFVKPFTTQSFRFVPCFHQIFIVLNDHLYFWIQTSAKMNEN